MKKIIILIFLIFISLILIPKVDATSVTKVQTDYYYTRYHPDGTKYSDRYNIHYIDNTIVYCIEPGVKLGNNYNVEDYNIPYENKLRILLAAYYGYFYENQKDSRYALATQSIIWKEILGTYPVFSTELWEKGEILDLTYYISTINNRINKYMQKPNLVANKELLVGNKIIFHDTNYVLDTYDTSKLNISTNTVQGNSFDMYFSEARDYNIKLNKKDYYNSNYKIYIDTDKQKLIMPGNIPELNFETTVTVKPVNIHFKFFDKETNEELHGITLNFNNDIIKDTDTYTLYKYNRYAFNQESVPDGYVLDKEIKYIDNYSEPDVTVKLKLQPIYNDFIINKTYDDIYPEENAIFELINNDTKKLQGVYYTDTDGTFKLHLRYGTYTLNQLKGIEGYTLVSETIDNTHPNNSKNLFTINLNDEKIIIDESPINKISKILNNDDEVNNIDHPYALELVQTGNNISLLFVLFLFISSYLLNKKIIAI